MEFHRQDSTANVIDRSNVCNTCVNTPAEQFVHSSKFTNCRCCSCGAYATEEQAANTQKRSLQCGGSRFTSDSLAPVLHSARQCQVQRICSYGARTLEENECGREQAQIRTPDWAYRAQRPWDYKEPKLCSRAQGASLRTQHHTRHKEATWSRIRQRTCDPTSLAQEKTRRVHTDITKRDTRWEKRWRV